MADGVQAFAPGKVILLGEHSAVYGEPAIAAAISRGVSAVAVPAAKSRFVAPAGLHASHVKSLKVAVERAFSVLKHPPVQVTLDSDLPLSMGLGSSGALSIAVARALIQSQSLNGVAPQQQVEAVAMEMEKTFHGTPSGIDHLTSSRGGIQYFQNRKPRALKVAKPLQAVIALVGERPSTRSTVAALRARVDRWPTRYRRQFKEIGLLVKEGAQAIERGDLETLGDIMNSDHGILAGMGLSGEKTDAMVHELRRLGALGAKLTGAGGNGGAVIALFSDSTAAFKKLKASGVQCFQSRFDGVS